MICHKQLLEDNYALERVIGCGGVGVVVAARHVRLGLRVALKFLRPDKPRDAEAVAHLVREGQIMARVRSTHVTRMLDIGRLADGEPFLVMEYLEGGDLGALLDTRGPLASRAAVAYVRQAAAGLAASHAHGVIHGDLKPSNLFLTHVPNGAPLIKLVDFGSAAARESSGEVTTRPLDTGSPPFVAPEQLRAERAADIKTDIWALGAVLFTLLAGRSPFERRYLSETYLAILSGQIPDLNELRPDIERPLVAIVERCLAGDPEQRFASAVELSAALAPFAEAAAEPASLARPRPGRTSPMKSSVNHPSASAQR